MTFIFIKSATALHAAAEHGHIKVVEVLLKYGAKQQNTMSNNYPYDTALQYRQYEIARLLKQHWNKNRVKANYTWEFFLNIFFSHKKK